LDEFWLVYHSPEKNPGKVVQVIYGFEELLKDIIPADFSFTFDTIAGKCKIGVKDGQSFFHTIQSP
jgi:hypothetical protein